MQKRFEEFGPPETACVYVRVDGVDDEYCAPLDSHNDDSSSRKSATG
jgi:hypothetical protein